MRDLGTPRDVRARQGDVEVRGRLDLRDGAPQRRDGAVGGGAAAIGHDREGRGRLRDELESTSTSTWFFDEKYRYAVGAETPARAATWRMPTAS